jgi:hypothetical protein
MSKATCSLVVFHVLVLYLCLQKVFFQLLVKWSIWKMILEMGVLLNDLVILVISVTFPASGFAVCHALMLVFCRRFGNKIRCANWMFGLEK